MKSFLKVTFVIALCLVVYTKPAASAETIVRFSQVDITVFCANKVEYLLMLLLNQYGLNFQAVENDFDSYTSGMFKGNAEKSIVILREPTQRYTVLVGEVEVQGRRHYCVFGGFRPFTSADAI